MRNAPLNKDLHVIVHKLYMDGADKERFVDEYEYGMWQVFNDMIFLWMISKWGYKPAIIVMY